MQCSTKITWTCAKIILYDFHDINREGKAENVFFRNSSKMTEVTRWRWFSLNRSGLVDLIILTLVIFCKFLSVESLNYNCMIFWFEFVLRPLLIQFFLDPPWYDFRISVYRLSPIKSFFRYMLGLCWYLVQGMLNLSISVTIYSLQTDLQ